MRLVFKSSWRDNPWLSRGEAKGCCRDGIAFMRSFEVIIIHPRCVHTAQEFRLFSYKRDRISGDVQPDLEDSSPGW
jgi:phage terminase large subunit